LSAAREEILGRIRSALQDVPLAERPNDVPVSRQYRRYGDLDAEERIERFAARLRDYHVGVRRVAADEVAQAVSAVCAEMEVHRVVVPTGLASGWRPVGIDVVEDDGLTAHQLDEIDGAVTGCAVAIAETGTVVLDGRRDSGRRLITLVPDHHICIVGADQIVHLVPEAVMALAPAVREQRLPVTLVSGPSASSDIELSRVEGVHGPRHLAILIAGEPTVRGASRSEGLSRLLEQRTRGE
jgi:L-lactate dehydrogenase complex protein LldG